MENNTQIQKSSPKKDIEALITGDRFRQAVSSALPKHCKPERFIRVALTAFNRTPKLRQCTQDSLFNCFLRLSELGIEADGRRAHLIPYGTECTLIVDYKGLAELIMRSGEVSHLHADIVCENDDFEYNLGEIVKHRIDFRRPRGNVFAAYALARLKDGNTACQVLSTDEVEAVRARSKAGRAGPWVTDWNEMAKKTAFRRLSKWLPLSPELRDSVEKDDDAIEVQSTKVVPVSQSFLAPPAPEMDDTTLPEDDAKLAAAGLAPASAVTTPPPHQNTPPSRPAATPPTKIAGVVNTHQEFQSVLDAHNITFDAWRQWAVAKGVCGEEVGSIEEVKPQILRAILKSGKETMLAELGVKPEGSLL